MQYPWYRFTLTKRDVQTFVDSQTLLSVDDDKMAGVLQLLIDDFGKMNDHAAKWLADHVAASPFLLRPSGTEDEPTCELVSVRDAGLAFDQATERFNNYRIWSKQLRDVRGHGGFQSLQRLHP